MTDLAQSIAELTQPTTHDLNRVPPNDTARAEMERAERKALLEQMDALREREMHLAIDQLLRRHGADLVGRNTSTASTPSLLDQLAEAVQGSGGSNGAGGAGAYRSAIGLAAAGLLAEIRRAAGSGLPAAGQGPALRDGAHRITDTSPVGYRVECTQHTASPCRYHLGDTERGSYWCRDCGWSWWQHTEAPLAVTLRTWLPVDEDQAAIDAARWVAQAKAIVEPPRWSEIPSDCPLCRRRYVWAWEDGERVRRATLRINLSHGYAECGQEDCQGYWDEDHLRDLAGLL